MSPRCHELEAANTSLDSIVDQLGDVHIEALKAPAHSLADVKHRQLLESSAAPDLPLRIRDLSIPGNAHEVFANTREPFVVDNETCRGRAILKGVLVDVDLRAASASIVIYRVCLVEHRRHHFDSRFWHSLSAHNTGRPALCALL